MPLSTRSKTGLLLISVAVLVLIAPAPFNLYIWDHDNLLPIPLPQHFQPISDPYLADLNDDGLLEQIALRNGSASVLHDDVTLWTSPPEWEVMQAQITDFNRDGNPEVTLLLWREFAPWPIDDYLAYPGRINDFHDRDNRSCHLILIGWRQQAFVEIWAGSALVDPLLEFAVVDLDRDGYQELVALESRYDHPRLSAHAVTVWEWNGFGFSLLSRGPEGRFQALLAVHSSNNPALLLVQGIPRR